MLHAWRLRALVPHRDEVEAGGEHAALDEAEEEARRDQAAQVLCEPLEYRDKSEEEHTEGHWGRVRTHIGRGAKKECVHQT